ncbi:hypothetical protein VYU27_009817, partial [Nannochloropsis oceanica]
MFLSQQPQQQVFPEEEQPSRRTPPPLHPSSSFLTRHTPSIMDLYNMHNKKLDDDEDRRQEAGSTSSSGASSSEDEERERTREEKERNTSLSVGSASSSSGLTATAPPFKLPQPFSPQQHKATPGDSGLRLLVEEAVRNRDVNLLIAHAQKLKGRAGLTPLLAGIEKHLRCLHEEGRLPLYTPNDEEEGQGKDEGGRQGGQGQSCSAGEGAEEDGMTSPLPSVEFQPSLPPQAFILPLVPQAADWILGQGESCLNEIMQVSACRMWIDNPAAFGEPCKLHFLGSQEQVEAALVMVNNLLQLQQQQHLQQQQQQQQHFQHHLQQQEAALASMLPPMASIGLEPTASLSSCSSAFTPADPPFPLSLTPSLPPYDQPHSTALLCGGREREGARMDGRGASSLQQRGDVMQQALQSLTQTSCMDCPPHLVGLLIGKKGWTIKKIQNETGAQ